MVKTKTKVKPYIKNNYTIYQIKKMIGKKLIILYPTINIKLMYKNLAKENKKKILETIFKNNKNIVLSAVCIKGIIYIISNIEYYLTINSISYKEIEQYSLNKFINIVIIQYNDMQKKDIKEILK